MKGEAKGREEIEEMRMATGNTGGGVERRRVKGTKHRKRRETKRGTKEKKEQRKKKRGGNGKGNAITTVSVRGGIIENLKDGQVEDAGLTGYFWYNQPTRITNIGQKCHVHK